MPVSRQVPRRFWVVCVGVFCVGAVVRVVADDWSPFGGEDRRQEAAAALELLSADRPTERTLVSYEGRGAWVDAFDFDPAYAGEGAEPPLDPSVVDDMASVGIDTIYLQAARRDDRAEGRLLDRSLLGEFLLRAHARDIDVVGWYLPLFDDVDADLDRLLAIAEFNVRGHRFDGVAVDIEFIDAVPDADERSARLVTLSQQLRGARPDDALGAIVPPPVQLEVINPDFWPRFPWRDLAGYYDAWLPMAYWTVRTPESGYRDAYSYSEESTRRLRANLGLAGAPVHLVGGIGDATTTQDLQAFSEALANTLSIGGSIYDWNSLSPERRAELSAALPARE